jgi:hypothetical protein
MKADELRKLRQDAHLGRMLFWALEANGQLIIRLDPTYTRVEVRTVVPDMVTTRLQIRLNAALKKRRKP